MLFVTKVKILGKWNYTIGVNITINASLYGYTKTIRNATDLCSFGSLYFTKEESDGGDNDYQPSCPLRKGSYELFTGFTVPRFSRDTQQEFTPDLYLEFLDADDGTLLGCAQTGIYAELERNRRRAAWGVRLFVICVTVFVTTFGICIIGHRRKRRRVNLLGEQKNASMIRRYHYHRTTRNGTVLVPNTSEPDTESQASAKNSSREVT